MQNSPIHFVRPFARVLQNSLESIEQMVMFFDIQHLLLAIYRHHGDYFVLYDFARLLCN